MADEPQRIFTIGYENATVDAVIAALRAAGVELLADVRALPLSRRPGFSKTALSGALREAGIGYRHWRALGTPADGRAAARRGDHKALERIYAGQLETPEALGAIGELREAASNRPTALLCYERDAAACHRRLLVEAHLADFAEIDVEPDIVTGARTPPSTFERSTRR